MRHSLALASLAMSASAYATVTPGSLFGDSYVVQDGARTYSVLDVYIKCGSTSDIISSIFGVSAYTSSYSLNNGKTFQQSNGTATSSWLPTNDDGKAWDSYVTCGARVQGSDSTLAGGKAGFLGLQLDTNWSGASNGGQIVGQNGGAGWYPSIGASTSTNPYCRGGYNGGTSSTAGWWNTAKFDLSRDIGSSAAAQNAALFTGNGMTAGMSLSSYWMIGRFAIDVTGTVGNFTNTLSITLAIAGKQNGTTTFTGATSTAGRFNYTLTFVPAPGAAALVGMAGFAIRRRRR